MLIERQKVDSTETFGERLHKIGNMIILLDAYKHPFYTKRVWCIFETYKATTANIPIDVALPEASKEQFYGQLTNDGFTEIAASLTTIDAESAEASVENDAIQIKSMIRKTIGFAAV